MDKEAIKSALAAIQTGNLLERSKQLLSTLGYRSDLTLELSGTVHDFFEAFPPLNPNSISMQLHGDRNVQAKTEMKNYALNWQPNSRVSEHLPMMQITLHSGIRMTRMQRQIGLTPN